MLDPTNLDVRLTTLFAEQLNLDVPSMETDLLATGLLDSMSFVDLLVHLEQEFDLLISMDDIEIENFTSIKAIVEFIINLK